MISSTRADLMEYRLRAGELLDRLRKEQQGKREIIEISMEGAVQTGLREYPVALSKKWVEEALWVIVIVGWHYGTITNEDGADGLGVTEWEYRHAMNLQKRVFVFVSGEPGTQNAYRALPTETNLLEWAVKQSDDQRAKITRFRADLGKQYADFFRDIDKFARQLENALRKALEDLLPPIPRGSGLAMLILTVKPAFLVCMSSIRSLNHYKDVHDALHNLRQFVITPIRERILLKWSSEGELSRKNERRLGEIRELAKGYLERIANSCKDLDETKAVDLLESVAKLNLRASSLSPFPDAEADLPTPLSDYTEAIDQFVAAAETAFSRANKRMLVEQRAFDDFHNELMNNLAKARREQGLGPEEDRTLTEEIQKLAGNKARLVAALNTHSEWQDLHDDMETVQGFRDTPKIYLRKLNDFVDRNASKLTRLAVQSPQALDTDPALDTILQDCLTTLKAALDAMGPDIDADRFDRMRNAFEKSFFHVDKRVLGVVQRSLDRVEQLDKLFYDLALPADP